MGDVHTVRPVPRSAFRLIASPARILGILACFYFLGAISSTWNVIRFTQSSTDAIEQILATYSMKNEGAEALDRYVHDHPFIGTLVSGPIRHEMQLPSRDEAAEALGPGVVALLKTVRHQSFLAAWWSWFFLNLSLFYVVLVTLLTKRLTGRPVLFSLTAVSVFCFAVGVLAPAMVIWTDPKIPLASGTLNFVLQYEVRGIAAIIWELLTSGHWIIGSLLLLFSIMTPLTKASLTFLVVGSRSTKLNHFIGEFLHTIGKWSMADVFVAGVLLALFALKSQQATKSIPCLGLYYFIGYCLLSLSTTELLVHSSAALAKEDQLVRPFALGGLFVLLLVFTMGSALYTYEEYTVNVHQKVRTIMIPEKLDNASLVLPAHK